VREGRGLAKGNPPKRNASRTQGRTNASSALERVRQAVTALWRYDPRQEPGALVAHAWSLDSEYFRKICAGGAGRPAFLPRPFTASYLPKIT